MAESKEDLKNLLMRMKKKGEKASLKLNIKKTKIMASGPITSWLLEGENVEIVTESRCSRCFNNFQMFKLVLKKAEKPAEEPEIKLPTFIGT